jgi:hypothetical protein
MRELLQMPAQHWKRGLPVVGSLALAAMVIWRVSPGDLYQALASLNWALLAPMSLALVAALYLWDSMCLWWLFKQPRAPLSYRATLRARGVSYLFTILNYGVGQGVLAWFLAKKQERGFLASATRCVMVTYADLCVLLTLGLIGGALGEGPRLRGVLFFCGLALSALAALSAAVYLLPGRWVQNVRQTRWGAALRSSAWRWRDLLPLGAMRLAYVGLGLIYITLALAVCGVALDPWVLIGVVPLVVLVDGLPISVGSLGTREAALLLLLDPFLLKADEPVLVAFSIVWSTCGLSGRALIGLGNLWVPKARSWLTGERSGN